MSSSFSLVHSLTLFSSVTVICLSLSVLSRLYVLPQRKEPLESETTLQWTVHSELHSPALSVPQNAPLLCAKDNKLLLQAARLSAQPMVCSEMPLQLSVALAVVVPNARLHAQMALFAVVVQFIVRVKGNVAETAFWVSFVSRSTFSEPLMCLASANVEAKVVNSWENTFLFSRQTSQSSLPACALERCFFSCQ